MPIKYSFRGKKLAEFIAQKGWNKAEFARRCHVDPGNVNRYLSGEFDPMNLASSLRREGCDLNWLCSDDEAPAVRESTVEYSAHEQAAIEAEAERLANIVKYSGPSHPSKRIRDEMMVIFRKLAAETILKERDKKKS